MFIGFVEYRRSFPPSQVQGLVRGVAAENIEGVDHIIEIYYSKPGLFNAGDIFKDLQLGVYPEDKITFLPDPSLGLGSRLVIKRATSVLVNDGGVQYVLRTWRSNISDLLKENEIIIGENDRIDPPLDTKISAGMELKITRVKITEIQESEKIKFKTIVKENHEMEKGQTKILQQGSEGLRAKTYQVVRENGKETSRTFIKSEVIKEPQDQIIYRGTKTVSYGEGIATWYGWITGMTAASNSLPFGTKVLVTNLSNSKQITVTIVDHGIQGEAVIDLSYDAFAELASPRQGKIKVRLEKP